MTARAGDVAKAASLYGCCCQSWTLANVTVERYGIVPIAGRIAYTIQAGRSISDMAAGRLELVSEIGGARGTRSKPPESDGGGRAYEVCKRRGRQCFKGHSGQAARKNDKERQMTIAETMCPRLLWGPDKERA